MAFMIPKPAPRVILCRCRVHRHLGAVAATYMVISKKTIPQEPMLGHVVNHRYVCHYVSNFQPTTLFQFQ